MTQIGIIAAMPAELRPLTREWPRTDLISVGHIGGVECLAACEGIGGMAATRSFQAIRAAASDLRALVSYGWAGALHCGVKPPGVYAVAEVIEARTGERFATDGPRDAPGAPLRLVTLDHVARRGEKRPLAERYGASLVDMEAATVGRLARAHGLGFVCLRGISDGYTDDLPDFNPFITRAGRLRTGALAAHALLRPKTWPVLLELGRNSRAAAEALARELPGALGRAGLVS